jgi:uncharacterized protein YggU (UPF0235/DUF167 family)
MKNTHINQFYVEKNGDVHISVRLTPQSSSNKIEDIYTDNIGMKWLKVRVIAVPDNNKANLSLVKLLAKYLCVPKSGISIISGHKNRNKRLELGKPTPELLEKLFDLC